MRRLHLAEGSDPVFADSTAIALAGWSRLRFTRRACITLAIQSIVATSLAVIAPISVADVITTASHSNRSRR